MRGRLALPCGITRTFTPRFEGNQPKYAFTLRYWTDKICYCRCCAGAFLSTPGLSSEHARFLPPPRSPDRSPDRSRWGWFVLLCGCCCRQEEAGPGGSAARRPVPAAVQKAHAERAQVPPDLPGQGHAVRRGHGHQEPGEACCIIHFARVR